jgi:hypothetical protein
VLGRRQKARLRALVFEIRRSAIPGTFNIYPVGEYYKYEYKMPCECGHPACSPESAFSVSTFNQEELAYVFEFAKAVDLNLGDSTQWKLRVSPQ